MTISEIAKMAGVSSAAVSRYFNSGYLSENKKEAIRRVVEETGYRPSLQAATLRTKQSKLIGVVVPSMKSASVNSMTEGIVKVLEQEGYHVLLAHTHDNFEKEITYLDVFNINNVDGIIFSASIFTPKHWEILEKKKIPVVLVGQKLKGYNCVYHDDYHAMYDMTRTILDKGRHNLSYIGAINEDKAVGDKRTRGFQDAVSDAGFSDRKSKVRISGFEVEDGYITAREIITAWPETDGLICATDSMAIGAIHYCYEHQIRIPEDIVITGQGDSDLSRFMNPTITTLHYYYDEAGQRAAGLLLDMIKNKEHKSVMQLKLGYEIIERESSCF